VSAPPKPIFDAPVLAFANHTTVAEPASEFMVITKHYASSAKFFKKVMDVFSLSNLLLLFVLSSQKKILELFLGGIFLECNNRVNQLRVGFPKFHRSNSLRNVEIFDVSSTFQSPEDSDFMRKIHLHC
jgi:hypothetical protein